MNATKYNLKDFVDGEKLRDDLAPNQHNLDLSLMSQAGLFAYYGTLAAQAQAQLDKYEQMEEIILARLDRKVRDRAIADGTKLTEPQVKAQIQLEPEAVGIRSAVNKARMIASVAKSAAEAFRHRRDMLIQLAINSREERKGELRVMDPYQQAQRDTRHARQEAILRS